MIPFAIGMTRLFVVENLANGVDKENTPRELWGCGPFNRGDSIFNISYGDGFDYDTETHLTEFFGFSNICANWDYTPARELTALYFPFFEYSLVIYLFLDFVSTFISYRRGELPKWFWILTQIFFPITVLLCIGFRMIFVCIAYESANQHTAGFLGLQVALIIVAVSNSSQILLTGQSYPSCCLGVKATAIIAIVYLVLNLSISSVKVYATSYIVRHGVGPDFYKIPVGSGIALGRIIDFIWMIMNAFLPAVIALVRFQNEDPFEVIIRVPIHIYRYRDGIVDDGNNTGDNELTRINTPSEIPSSFKYAEN